MHTRPQRGNDDSKKTKIPTKQKQNTISNLIEQKKTNQKSKMADDRLQMRLKLTKKAIADRRFSEITDFEILDYALSFVLPLSKISDISNTLIIRYGSVHQVLEMPAKLIQDFKILSPKTAEFLSLVGFLVQSRIHRQIHETPIFKDSNQLHQYLIATVSKSRYEHLRVLYLDYAGYLIADEELHEPTPAVATIPLHKILRHAILRESSGFLLVRNIPSRDTELNDHEIAAIQQLHDVCQMISLEMIDFLIVRDDTVQSLFECGLIHG